MAVAAGSPGDSWNASWAALERVAGCLDGVVVAPGRQGRAGQLKVGREIGLALGLGSRLTPGVLGGPEKRQRSGVVRHELKGLGGRLDRVVVALGLDRVAG